MEIVPDGDGVLIEGEGSARARIAYASEEEGKLKFVIQKSSATELSPATLKQS